MPQEASKARGKEASPKGWAKARIGGLGLLLCGPEQRVIARDEVTGIQKQADMTARIVGQAAAPPSLEVKSCLGDTCNSVSAAQGCKVVIRAIHRTNSS